MRFLMPLLLVVATGCNPPAPPPPVSGGPARDARAAEAPPRREQAPEAPPRLSMDTAARNFVAVVDEIEPVAERQCRARAPRRPCDFRILVDDRPGQPANAFQTLNENGRPIIAVTLPLIADARNRDEMAFILSHEAAHHILGHLPRQQRSAAAGAVILGTLAQMSGGSERDVRAAQNIGATIGARTYAKDLELEADSLGARIAERSGYDAVTGANFFFRIPDPGDQFLGTHPPNAQRRDVVRRAAARAG